MRTMKKFVNVEVRELIERYVNESRLSDLKLLLKIFEKYLDGYNLSESFKAVHEDYQAAIDFIIVQSLLARKKDMLIYGLSLKGATANFKHGGDYPIIFLATERVGDGFIVPRAEASAELTRILIENGADLEVTGFSETSVTTYAERWLRDPRLPISSRIELQKIVDLEQN